MLTNMKIRHARQGDGKAIAESLYQSCNAECKDCYNKYLCNESKFSEKKIADIDKRLGLKQKHYLALVAIDSNSNIIGFSSCLGNGSNATKHRAECGWFVSSSHMHQGIATKLVNRLMAEAKKKGIRKLEAESAVDNIASVRLAQKLGFVIEGTKKAALKVGNKYMDSYILGKVLK